MRAELKGVGWVLVREAAEATGLSESKLRAAYRAGRIEAHDDLVGGRLRKLVELDEVWQAFGLAAPEQPEVLEPEPSDDHLVDALRAEIDDARTRAGRAEQQVVFLRNEIAQLQGSHERVREIVDRLHVESFRASAGTVAATVLARPPRRRFTLFARQHAR